MSERHQRASCKGSRRKPRSRFRRRAGTAMRSSSRAMHSSSRLMGSIAISEPYEALPASLVCIGVSAAAFNGGQRVG
jgi:hypothetical protein